MSDPIYNSATPGGLMQGISSLLQGLGAIRDPHAADRNRLMQLIQTNPQIRDQYIQQYGNNPEALAQLLGRKPLFGRSNYDSLLASLSGPLSPEGQAKADAARATSAEAANRTTIAQGLAPTLKQGVKVDAFVNRGEGGVQLPAPSAADSKGDAEKGILDIPIIRGPGMSDDEYQTYREALTNKGVQTPAERQLQKSQIAHQEALTRQEQTKTKKTEEQIAQAAKDEKIASEAIKGLGSQNLYVARKAGKLNDVQIAAIQNSVRGSKRYEDDQNAFFKEQQLKLERDRLDQTKTQISNGKRELLRNNIYEHALQAGAPISMNQIDQAIDHPDEIMKSDDPEDQPIKKALTSIRDFAKKGELQKALAIYMASVRAVQNRVKENDVTEGDIREINDAALAFAGTGFRPPIVGITDVVTPRSILPDKHKKIMGYVDKPDSGIQGLPTLPIVSKTEDKPKTKVNPADAFESLRKKYPKETVDQLTARVNKGES